MTPVEKTADDEAELISEDDKFDKNNEQASETTVSAARELTESEIPEEIEKSISEYDLSKLDWKKYLEHFTFVANGIANYRAKLIQAESDADQKVCDVLHYIELCDVNSDEAEELIELLKVCRENRRDIKDEILRVDTFQRNVGTTANIAKAKETLKAIKGLEKRKYTPRKFAELFDGSELKLRPRAERCKSYRTGDSVPENNCKELYEDYEEAPQMTETRSETLFDGGMNDWMSFAIQQAEFYKNAHQYIVNLHLDIEDIDSAIAELIEQIEVANCNVAQGYKMFKQLKDLRLQRKDKQKELESLYILTDYIDVDFMAEECNRKVSELQGYLYGKKEETVLLDDYGNEIAVEQDEATKVDAEEACEIGTNNDVTDLAV